MTKYQRSNFIIQILQFTVKITAINIILLVEYIMFLEFNLIFRVFPFMSFALVWSATFSNSRCVFYKSRRETTAFDQFCFREGLKTSTEVRTAGRWLPIVSIFQMQISFFKAGCFLFYSSAGTVCTKIPMGACRISCKTFWGISTHFAGDLWSS